MVKDEYQACSLVVGAERIHTTGQTSQGATSGVPDRGWERRPKQGYLCVGDLCSGDTNVRGDKKQQALKGKHHSF